MDRIRQPSSWRFLPLVVAITAAIIGSPLVALTWVESTYNVQLGPIPAAAVAIAFSAALGAAGSALWMRHPRSRDIVFGDLMLWGYVRRLVNERRVLRATAALGLDRSTGRPRAIQLSPERQTEILQRLANALEANDPYSHGHSRRVARHALMIARAIGLSAESVDKVYTAASIHDIGKLHLPPEILNKPAKLTDTEYEVIKEHPSIGAAMAADLGNGEVTAIVRHHHERLDGRGYPDGLRGDDIPMGSRIIAVADTFDALTSTRAYRDASEHKVAIDIIKKEAGAQLDGSVVEAFLRYYSGRRSRTWWSAVTTMPERLMGWLGTGVERIGVAGVANGITAAGAAAVIAGASIAAGPAPREGLDRNALTSATVGTGAVADGNGIDDGDSATGDAGADRGDRDERSERDGGGSDPSGGSGGDAADDQDSGAGDSISDGSGTGDSGSTDTDGGSGSNDSGSGSDGSGSGSDGSGTDNSGSGSDSSGSGSDGSGSGDSGDSSGSDSGSGDGDGGGLIGEVVDTVEDTGCGLLGLLC